MPGKYYGYNISISNDSATGLGGGHPMLSTVRMPNGVYRNIYILYSDEDKKLASFWYHVESYDPQNAGNDI